ncbi:bZIP transcription factor 53-like [Dendrobium catenatum]|uniref:Ocs element-binding factor 1 n=1 Tax=Dendrobium catenatum TaxID=906689 RepID=A0A2I0X0K3_9ASPA|nr:bZIP transcription factor 53-like [Dendrobium catenatum]XP_020696067.1 bZIP transcription factor 53-like [Dendrobium catenatum]PKU81407.1 Ocs element-binding factor 1 [Dendrobium catenatum]
MTTEEIDERKRKRMLSNRESARRSRMKKQQHLDDMMSQISQFKEENDGILNQVNLISTKCSTLDAENSAMRSRVMELTERLKFLNTTLKQVEEKSGMAMDIPEIPDTILKPWPFTCSVQPLLRSAYMFQC